MTAVPNVSKVEAIIGYTFKKKDWIKLALTAPYREENENGEEESHEGNRELAQLGEQLASFKVMDWAMEKGGNREVIQRLKELVQRKDSRAKAAMNADIQDCIKYHPRQTHVNTEPEFTPSSGTLSLTVCAIIAAVYKDSGDIDKAYETVQRLMFTGDVLNYARRNNLLSEEPQGQYHDLPSISNNMDPSTSSSHMGAEYPSNSSIDQGIWSPTTFPPLQTTIDGGPWVHVLSGNIEESGYPNPNILMEVDATAMGHVFDPDDIFSDFNMLPTGGSDALSSPTYPPIHPLVPTPFFPPIEVNQSLAGLRLASHEVPEPSTSNIPQEESIENSSESHTQRPTTKRSGPATKNRNKKPRTAQLIRPASENLEVVQQLITIERAKYDGIGMGPIPRFLEDETLNQIAQIGTDENRSALQILAIKIAGPYSVSQLQDMVHEYRNQEKTDEPIEGPVMRLRAIDQLDRRLAYTMLLRWCHIHKLYEETDEYFPEDGFFVRTLEMGLPPKRGKGNPLNTARSDQSKAMKRRLYPNLPDDQWLLLEAKFKEYRRLGGRLSKLTKRFGYGVLGLLLYQQSDPSGGKDLERTLMSLKDEQFSAFLEILDNSQGFDILKPLSKDASTVLEAFVSGNLLQQPPFRFEEIPKEEIIAIPKGSIELRRLFLN